MKAWIEITQGEYKGTRFELKEGSNVLGRSNKDPNIVVDIDLSPVDPQALASAQHARIDYVISGSEQSLSLYDLGSLNGTYLLGSGLIQPNTPVELSDGDQILAGGTPFVVRLSR